MHRRQGKSPLQVSRYKSSDLPLEPTTELEVLDNLRQGDKNAFDALFRRFYGPLCRYAANLTGGDMDEAEDLVQQTFVKLWEQRATIEVRHSVKAYLYKAVHNRALNRLRANRTREKYHHQTAMTEEAIQPQSPEPAFQKSLQQALEALPPQCRQVFELSRFEELKYREIADLMQISIKTVETQMGKALRLMRLHLAEFLTLCLFFFR